MDSKLFLIFFTAIIFYEAQCAEDYVIETPLGKVKGQLKQSFDGRNYVSFEGIPYAKPPIGDLRFAEPVPIEPWSGTLDASTLYTCFQDGAEPGGIGNEDCLYLNVYVPEEKSKEKLDVIVQIHGGGFMVGSAHEYCHPEYLMDRNIILVSINYRLGLFGFLSAEDNILPGNYGMKDQTTALIWIKDNIENFGGNPNSVTLTGISAGAVSVHYHYFSPLSKNLFHRGISHSGTALNNWALQKHPLDKVNLLADSVGCSNSDTKEIVKCLRQQPAEVLQSKVPLLYGFYNTPAPFGPVVEEFASNPFLPKNPFYLLSHQKILDVPWIASQTQNEGLLFSTMLTPVLETINEQWTEVAPFILNYNYTKEKDQWTSTAIKIKNFYFGEENDISMETFSQFTKMLGHRYSSFDSETAARVQSIANKAPVHFYNLNYVGSHSFLQLFTPTVNETNTAVTHGDDAFYLYASKYIRPDIPFTEADLQMKDAFINFYTHFAQTGEAKFEDANWEPIDNGEFVYLNITSLDDLKIHRKEELSPRQFWHGLGFIENQKTLFYVKDEL